MNTLTNIKENGYDILSNWLAPDVLANVQRICDNTPIAMGETWACEYKPALDAAEYMHYWTNTVIEDHYIKDYVLTPIKLIVDDMMGQDQFVQRGADFKVTNPTSSFMYVHFDTPYRHDRWANDWGDEILGLQVGIALDRFDLISGGTRLLPGSHKRVYLKPDMEAGIHNQEFLDHGHSMILEPGDMFIYHSRTMHSTMPNLSNVPRRLMLCLHINKTVIDELTEIESGR